ncbi:MAG TPA: M48 family metallopeptidase, partial [Thermodesulfobacteriota bacterium]|nr:M48 family metallopeptidase [Thermodesulfobacteriota bacterium]
LPRPADTGLARAGLGDARPAAGLTRRTFLAAGAAVPVLVAGCATVPETGRSQLILLPESQMVRLGAEAYREALKGQKVSTDPEANAMVRRVGERIARASGRDYDWEFTVLDDPKTINAFALPGGKVAVYTGILPVAQDDAGLATVMGHEVAHATARHGAERLSQGLVAQLALAGAGLTLQDKDPATRQAILAALGVGATVGVLLPFSRRQESEADRIGLRYMARAGYEPEAAVAFWERMEAATRGRGGRPPEFLSTHPSGPTRIAQLRAWLPEARAEFRPHGG